MSEIILQCTDADSMYQYSENMLQLEEITRISDFHKINTYSPHYLHFYQTEWRTKRFPFFFFSFYKTLDESQWKRYSHILLCGLNESNLSTRKNYSYREINSSLIPCVALISSLPEYHEPHFIYCFYLYT